MKFHAIKQAIHALKNGKMVLLTDSPDRENEADFVFPAQTITLDILNMMFHHGSGIICVPLPEKHLDRLGIPLMIPETHNTTQYNTAFTLPIDAKHGVQSGISTADRLKTIQTLISPETRPDDLIRPGHIYPLRAKAGGVLARNGHTEGALDLVTLAGFQPAAVICEVMNRQGNPMKGNELRTFSQTHGLPLVSVDDVLRYTQSH